MSSPFSLFRKHQKQLMVFLCVLAAFAFVIGPYLVDMVTKGERSGGAGATQISWAGGTLSGKQINKMRDRQLLTVRFLQAALKKMKANGGTSKEPNVREQGGQFILPFMPPTALPNDVMRSLVMSERAESMGIYVNDETITDFLYRLTDDVVTGNDFDELLKTSTGNRLNKSQLYDELRKHLQAQQLYLLSSGAQFAKTPAEKWESLSRYNRRVVAEILPLEVAKFKDQVSEKPTDAEIRSLYDKHKDEFSYPQKPDPGFKQLSQASFEYVKISLDPFMQEEIAKAEGRITDEAIEQHYERNKSQYQVLVDDATKDTEAGSETDPKSGDEGKDEKKQGDVEDVSKPDADASEENSDAKTEPATNNKDDDADVPPTPKSNENGASSKQSKVKFVSFPQPPADDKADDSDEPASDNEKDNASTDEPKLTAPTQTDSKKQDAVDASPKKNAGDRPPEPRVETMKTKPEPKSTDDKPPAQPESKPATPEPPAPIQYKPLDDELRDEIRQDLAKSGASPIANERYERAISELEAELEEYYSAYTDWEIGKDEEGGPAKPDDVDFAALAKKYRGQAGATELTDMFEIEEEEIGKASAPSQNPQTGRFQRMPFRQIAFDPALPLFDPGTIEAAENDATFVFWKNAVEEERTPALDEVRDDVVDAWTTLKARELAMAEAEKRAQQVTESGKTLKETFPSDEKEIIETEGFSWVTLGNAMGGIQLSQIPGVTGVDYDFMEQTFGLDAGEATAIENAFKDTAYVVRLVKEEKTTRERRTAFLEAFASKRGSIDAYVANMISNQDDTQLVQQWVADLQREMGVDVPEPPQ